MKVPSTSPDSRADTKTKPRERPIHLILLGFLAATTCYLGIVLRVRLENLFGSYKSAIWSLSSFASERLHHIFRTKMRIVLLSALGFCTGTLAQAGVLDPYIVKMSPIAKAGVLANIGPNGTRSSGAKPGVVIASPSTHDPDYLYTWTRDSSLVFKGIIDWYTQGQDNLLRGLIDDFVSAQTILQQVPNPSGNVSTGGLGEPKFLISLGAFTDGWGRPQRDGPALRSIALITYADWLIAHSNSSHVQKAIWPVVKLDLDYVSNRWNTSGFDLWEELSSASFFTSAVQHKALRQGVTLAKKLGMTSVVDAWTAQANNILCFMQTYWNPSELFITSNTQGGRTGKDANSALAAIHTFDAAAGCDAATFQPCSDKALASLKVYVDSFRSEYTINKGIPANAAVATGRYSEDVYFGGNPWYLTTAAVAEQLYDALIVWKARGSLSVTNISLPFFRQFIPAIATGTYTSSSTTFKNLINAIQNHADGFLVVNAKYTPADGSLAEQYDRENGSPLSATHLTWSYAATLSAFAARKGTVPASWGAKGLKVPVMCEGNPGPIVKATFNVVAQTVPGENIYLTGSVDQLKNWSPDNAIPLSASGYPTWSVSLDLPASTNLEYKYIRKKDGAVTWESDPNNHLTTPATGSFNINDSWR